MLHALPRRSWRERAGRPVVLPALLITAAAGAFGGLAVAGPAVQTAAEAAPRPVALPFTPPVVALEQPADLERASRSRPRVVPPKPKPVVVPSPVAAPKPPPAPPEPVRAPRPKRSAARVEAPAAAARSGGTCPVPSASFTDTYGAARSGGRSHQGTDLLAPYGAPVYAVASGVIDTASSSNGGISLYLRASNGERYFYAHNSENVARDGQRVEAGELIARVGSTGNAGSTNHVHFEREVGGQSVNPYRFLRAIC